MNGLLADHCSHCGVNVYLYEHKKNCKRPLIPTPPPWRIAEDFDKTITIYGKRRDGRSEVVYVENDDCDPDESAANARLIAAAPEMLKVLANIVARADPGGGATPLLSDRSFREAVAVIKKARGK